MRNAGPGRRARAVRKAALASIVVLSVTACAGGHGAGRAGKLTFHGGGTQVVSATTKGIGFSVPTFPWLSPPSYLALRRAIKRLGAAYRP